MTTSTSYHFSHWFGEEPILEVRTTTRYFVKHQLDYVIDGKTERVFMVCHPQGSQVGPYSIEELVEKGVLVPVKDES